MTVSARWASQRSFLAVPEQGQAMAAGCARRVQPDRIVDIEHEPAPVRGTPLERQGRQQVYLALNQGHVQLSVQRREPSPQPRRACKVACTRSIWEPPCSTESCRSSSSGKWRSSTPWRASSALGIFVRTRNDGAFGPERRTPRR